ncbi:PTS glucose/sucrose transporter subunit IIB [Prauserella isguenensis]|uniref:PTS glucose/sucrose transporter subunit IIB n=1 Tax=Prauserella isguenensis TaxID=1470180 RepID=UPI0031B619C3
MGTGEHGGTTEHGRTEQEAAMADERPGQILAALGGADNVVEIEGCITRLRCELEDGSVVDEAALKQAGAHGVMKSGAVVQVVVGPEADAIAEDIQDLL